MVTFSLLIACCKMYPQEPAPSFEVASIRPLAQEEQHRLPIAMMTYAGGRIRITNYTLRGLIHEAYGLENHQIIGGPSWIDDDRYFLEAKPPDSSPASRFTPSSVFTPPSLELRLMLRSLLAERFDLKTHREAKMGDVFSLVVVRGGPKLGAPKDTSVQPFVQSGRTGSPTAAPITLTYTGQNATMDQFAAALSQRFQRPVLNRTGLSGHYDFVIQYAPSDFDTDAAPSLVRAIQDQAGLKLETQHGPMEVLVIDQAKKPTPN
jgi:uncharacterized protein (TIGR03435 family)